MDLAAGLHNKLADIPELVECAEKNNCSLYDVRYPTQVYPVANGKPRTGKLLLTVGTDCSCGKMYTSLAIAAEMKKKVATLCVLTVGGRRTRELGIRDNWLSKFFLSLFSFFFFLTGG